MNFNKNFIYYIFLLSLLFGLNNVLLAQDTRRTLKAGSDYAYYPYEYVNEFNQADGFDIDILKAISEELDMNVDIESGNWFSIKKKIEKGEIDLVAGMFFHTDRASKVNFSMPYIIITHSIFVNKGDYWQSLKDVRDEENLKVVVENSSILHKYLTTAGIRSDRIFPVENQLDALRILSESDNTCALLPELQGKYVAKKNGFDNIHTVGLPILPREYSIAVNKSDTLLLNEINDAITAIHNNGNYEKIYQKWFGEYQPQTSIITQINSNEIILISLSFLFFLIIIYQYYYWRKYKSAKNEFIAKEALELQKANSKLNKSESLLRKVTEGSPYSIAIINNKGQFLYVNRLFEDKFGHTKKELNNLEYWLGISILEESIQKQTKATIFSFLHKSSADPDIRNISTEAIQMYPKSRKSLDMIIKMASLGEGKIILFFEDITENKQKILKLEKAKNEAESADQQKSSFLANISHEIRTPMNSIMGFSSLMVDEDSNLEDKLSYYKIIKKNGDLLLLLIQDIIDISKIEAGILRTDTQLIQLQSIINDAYQNNKENYDRKIPDPIDFTLQLPEHIEYKHYFIRVDKYRISQVLNNVISNAFKYTDKGSIELGIEEIDHQKIRIYVKDTGIGIKEVDQKMIFNRFTRVNSKTVKSRRGTGLGLTISNELLKLFGSELLMESEFNKGSKFYFDLPFYQGPGEILDRKLNKDNPSSNTKYQWEGKTIVIIEDNMENAKFLSTALKKTNCQTLLCENGKKALDMIENHPQVDLVLLDWLLPDMKGDILVQKIKSININTPIIVISAMALLEEQNKIKENNIDELMSKPVDKNYLLHRINHFLNEIKFQ